MTLTLRIALIIALFVLPNFAHAQDERIVDLDGVDFRVWTKGLEARTPDQPIFVFENGSVSPLESWSQFPRLVAELGPVITYDRSTLGESEWDGKIGTPEHVTANLWALLRALEANPPFVLIGWSWGGDLALQHARAHPNDVVGVVLIDPPMQSGQAELDILRDIGVSPSAHLQTLTRMRAEIADLSEAMRADVLPIYSIFESLDDPDVTLPPTIGVAALVAGKRPTPPIEVTAKFGPFPYDFQVHHNAKTLNRVERLTDLVFGSNEGALYVFPNEAHALHRNRPEVVIEAIKQVLPKD